MSGREASMEKPEETLALTEVVGQTGPSFYANGFSIASQAFGVQFNFLLQSPDGKPVTVATIHVSPQLAKVIGRLIRHNVRVYEEQIGGKIGLPDQLLDALKVRDLEE